MRQVKFAEVWTDDSGTIAVKSKDGDYRVYIAPDAFGRQVTRRRVVTLAEDSFMRKHIIETKTKILNALRREL